MLNVVIGIDPAFRKNGFAAAFIDLTDNTLRVKRYKGVTTFLRFVMSEDAPPKEGTLFIVENSNLQNVSFDKRGNKMELSRKSRNVGANQAVSQITVDFLEEEGYEVYGVSPRNKGGKLDHAMVKMLLKQEGIECPKRTNQDQRDAIKLALLYKRLMRYEKKEIKYR